MNDGKEARVAAIDSQALARLFPRPDEIPAGHRVQPIHQRETLVGGRLLTWDGERRRVLSPVCTRDANGDPTQVEIGSYPVEGEPQSDAALDAAVAAYDNGRGAWPTMTVAERIACMQDFV